MLKKVESYILKNNLLTGGAKVIVGTSGGADSIALLHILKQLGFQCVAAHCNFHLRNEESNRDEQFVREFASKLGLEYHKIDFDTTLYAQTNKVSIEMAARDLRYNWFEELRTLLNAEAVAVAHHADDNVETLLMNLTRGTGLRGMTGIPIRNGFVIRPLLCCSRQDIINYLNKNNLHYVTDSTNSENEYVRNRFRNEIIPTFEAINPAFRQTVNDTINRFEEIEEMYDEYIEFIKNRIISVESGNTIINTDFIKTKKYAKTILYEILSPFNFHIDTISNILICLDSAPGALFYSQTHQLLHDRNQLILSDIKSVNSNIYNIEIDNKEIFEPIHLKICRRRFDGKINKSSNYATFDAAKIIYPLTLRHWQQADSFVPFGMKTHKKVSDFFIDNKINRFEKENTWLLLSGNDIIWVVGQRTDNRYSVDKNTSEVIEIELIK